MKLEYRFGWVDEWNPETCITSDILSIGSESCLVPLFQENLVDAITAMIKKGMPIKLVTPRVAQKDIQKVLSILLEIKKRGLSIDIVINDWGLFFYCSQWQETFRMHIGRQLCRSLLDCPWHGEIIANETDNVRQVISEHPYTDSERLDFLQQKGVVGVELNAVGGGDLTTKRIKAAGFQVAVHCDEYLLSCGAVCLAKRLEPGLSCKELCKKRYQAKPHSKWLNSFDSQVPFTDYEISLLEGLLIRGNTVTLPQRRRLQPLDSVDTLITTKINNNEKEE